MLSAARMLRHGLGSKVTAMSSRRKPLVALALVVVLAIAGGAYYRYRAERSRSTDILTLYGNIDIREADLAFNLSGRIDRMLVNEGDTVRKGQLLAELEARRYEAEVAAAKARIAARRATLDRLLAGSRREEIERARADADAIKAELRDAEINLRRTQKLAINRFASLQKLDSSRAHVNALTAQLQAAQQLLSLAIQGPRKEDIAKARADLQEAKADLALALDHLRDSRLFAKDDGVVKTRIMEPGAVVLANTPVYTIALTDPVWVRTYVSEPDLGYVRPGMKAAVFTDSAPETAHEGWVGFVSPVAEFTPKTVETTEVRTNLVYRLRVYVKNNDGSLRQGMPVTVRLTRGGKRRTSVPKGN